MKKYRIAAVSYVNTLPFLHGLRHTEVSESIDVILAHPAQCAALLERGEADIALCPVGALQGLGSYHLLTDYCIGCDGPVRTVSVYASEPFADLKEVVLFGESRTSNLLVQLLNRESWKRDITFLAGAAAPAPQRGHLFIGDVCFQKEKEFAYRTDLGAEWKKWTGLPFAFACWVSRAPVDDLLIDRLNEAFAFGVRNIDQLHFPAGSEDSLLRQYLRENIDYRFDEGKRRALELFLASV